LIDPVLVCFSSTPRGAVDEPVEEVVAFIEDVNEIDQGIIYYVIDI
jgi:hypothetical protein